MYSVCTLLSERDPEHRVEYNQDKAEPWEISARSEKLKEFHLESQTWEEKDRGEEGGTTWSVKMSEGSREVQGFEAVWASVMCKDERAWI